MKERDNKPSVEGQATMEVNDEFRRLNGIYYLDHAGGTLYSEKQMESIIRDYADNVYGNPHSQSSVSRHTSGIINQIRFRVLQHFNTNLDEYDLIFTAGATAALKLVAECFNFGKQSPGVFVYAQENHTSVLGMREAVSSRCSSVVSLTTEQIENIFSDRHSPEISKTSIPLNDSKSLFVFSGLCNFSGRKSPLSWVTQCQDGCLLNRAIQKMTEWSCLLDAAALAATNPLDLSVYRPDFVTISFYKIFGYPTGLGALLVKKSKSHLLSEKQYFGGGTVLMALSSCQEHILRPVLHERFEDGTVSFLSIIALGHGFDTLLRIAGSMSWIQKHTFSLARRVHHSLTSLHHSNGEPVSKIYCDSNFEDSDAQGAIVNFNLLRADGSYVPYSEVMNLANAHNIQLRTGCFCNPGACQRHLNLTDDELRHHFQAGHVCGDSMALIDGVPTGSVRVSFGYMSTETDIDKFMNMVYFCFVDNSPPRFSPINGEKWFDAIEDCQTTICGSHDETADTQSSLSGHSGRVELSQLVLYPVKSCGGFRPSGPWAIASRGLVYDRTWMVITASGAALTQSAEPRLACVNPCVDLENNKLHLSFLGSDHKIFIPLNEVSSIAAVSHSICQSKVCGDMVLGQDCGDEAASWLCKHLERHGLRLLRQLDDDGRQKQALALSNKAQFLLVSETSVSWLRDRIAPGECDETGLVNRFRANLVVRGLSVPFTEFNWKEVRIGDEEFVMDGPCTRCGVVCVDQATGKRTSEPLRTLSRVLKNNVKFGIYLTHRSSRNCQTNFIAKGNKVTDISDHDLTNI